jgi:hypothetical protein
MLGEVRHELIGSVLRHIFPVNQFTVLAQVNAAGVGLEVEVRSVLLDAPGEEA